MTQHNKKLTYSIGVDLGGTNFRIALVRSDGKILKLIKTDDDHDLLNLKKNLEKVKKALHIMFSFAKAENYKINGLGLAIGCLIGKDQTISSASRSNMLPEQKVELSEIFPEFSPEKIVMENDSKAAAYGEYRFGAGVGYKNLICLTLGTGIGGGTIINGKLLHGQNGYAGHVGFMPIKAYDPTGPQKQRIYFEEWASGVAIQERAIEGIQSGRVTSLESLSESKTESINAVQVFNAARQGDEFAEEIIKETTRVLGVGIASLIHMFNPDVIILGGGVADQGEILFNPVREVVREIAMLRYCNTPIIPAKLGNTAGVIGAAALTGF